MAGPSDDRKEHGCYRIASVATACEMLCIQGSCQMPSTISAMTGQLRLMKAVAAESAAQLCSGNAAADSQNGHPRTSAATIA